MKTSERLRDAIQILGQEEEDPLSTVKRLQSWLREEKSDSHNTMTHAEGEGHKETARYWEGARDTYVHVLNWIGDNFLI